MSAEVKIPAVGESITSGLLSTWHKEDGETVAAGDVLLTLETDKVSTELTAETAGRLKIKVPAGQEVKIGEVVGTIEAPSAGSGPAADAAQPGNANLPMGEAAKPAAPAAAPLSSPPAQTVAPAHSTPAIPVPAEAPKAEPASKAPAPSEAKPVPAAPAPAAAAAGVTSVDGRFTRKRLSPIRRKIAAQLVMAQQTAAILTTFNEVDMSAVMSLRKDLQEAFLKEHGLKLGFMSFFVKAAVSALQAIPAINSRMDGEDLIQNSFYDIGVAIGTERGLVVPVVRNADQKSFAQIERDILDYALKAKEGKIKIEDLTGGVFTISNGGTYGSLLSTPILNPPQSGILGMHKIQERPVAEKGQVVIRPMMYLALSYDHRVVDGKEAVTFLIRIKECIESPARLLLGL
ncbi:MAG TPA: 2-oxoglutarate dehydrogenase complex dihydrolipoyllysine-residue succinyltransferase [Chthoniobacteraceae bacterium]|jgi:2-oxoglutarate dehydrogenase E2 component (dihydrolipoamide succinyltransferase)|nr:2-oxoglutarate dehydrogenase complex dihydrolipoyllysine-residue succinyltransferase [Chthoniobacteraceae bacterium]